MNYYLGIDGGGTKTHAVIIDENFNIVYDKKFESTHIITAGEEKFINIMSTIYNEALQITNSKLKYMFCALAGYGEFKNDNEKIENILTSIYQIPYKVLNDSVGVWAGGLLCENGIGLIAGTGSCCCGISNNEYTRVGGWGYIAGDEASAYWIATKSVNAYMKIVDGRLQTSIIKDEIDKAFNLDEENNILNLIYRKMDCKRPEIAQIAKSCSIAAEKGCKIANEILDQAAYELFDHISTTALKMNTDYTIPVTYTGGVFNSKVFKSYLISYMEKSKNDLKLVEPITNAGHGSAIYAYVLAGNDLTKEKRKLIKNKI